MKASTILIFLLFAFTTKTSFTIASDSSVLDVEGNEMQTGVEYYVVSPLWGPGGGGLALGRLPDQKCPEIVVQSQYSFDYGLPVTFSTMDSADDVVNMNVNLTIEFIRQSGKHCTSSSLIWQAVLDESTGKYWVIIGGVKGEPATVFTIKKHEIMGYTFHHCPSEDSCSDIGKYMDRGHIRLGLSENPGQWVFIKAAQSKTIKQVVNVA